MVSTKGYFETSEHEQAGKSDSFSCMTLYWEIVF